MEMEWTCPDCGHHHVFDSKNVLLTCENCGRSVFDRRLDFSDRYADEGD